MLGIIEVKIKLIERMTSLTGTPKVDPERAALTASVDPRRGGPESTEKTVKIKDREGTELEFFLINIPTAKYACICSSSHWI
jgi:hypothetical protein